MLGLSFTVSPAAVEERRRPGEPPRQYVRRLAHEKTGAGSLPDPETLTIAGDTIVVLGERVFEKPTDAQAAVEMLRSLSGRRHTVMSGLALSRQGRTASRVATASVKFLPLGPEPISRYVQTGEPLDKAGGYGIQGCGSAFVESVEGDFFAVVGLSVAAFVDALPELGLDYRPGAVFALQANNER